VEGIATGGALSGTFQQAERIAALTNSFGVKHGSSPCIHCSLNTTQYTDSKMVGTTWLDPKASPTLVHSQPRLILSSKSPRSPNLVHVPHSLLVDSIKLKKPGSKKEKEIKSVELQLENQGS
jgi:hypothetical protein